MNSRLLIYISGVPQSSNLGPLLFLVYTNNSQLRSLFFSDDLKIHRLLKKTHTIFYIMYVRDLSVSFDSTLSFALEFSELLSERFCANVEH